MRQKIKNLLNWLKTAFVTNKKYRETMNEIQSATKTAQKATTFDEFVKAWTVLTRIELDEMTNNIKTGQEATSILIALEKAGNTIEKRSFAIQLTNLKTELKNKQDENRTCKFNKPTLLGILNESLKRHDEATTEVTLQLLDTTDPQTLLEIAKTIQKKDAIRAAFWLKQQMQKNQPVEPQ